MLRVFSSPTTFEYNLFRFSRKEYKYSSALAVVVGGVNPHFSSLTGKRTTKPIPVNFGRRKQFVCEQYYLSITKILHRKFPSFSDSNSLLFKAGTYNKNDDNDDSNSDNNITLLKNKIGPEDIKMIVLLENYKLMHGDCHVPTGTRGNVCRERERLGVSDDLADWVVNQRKQRRQSTTTRKGKGKNNAFSAKVSILNEMGFMWSCREAQWQRSFNRLESYGKNHNGNLSIKKQDDLKLYIWTEQQRKAYRRGSISVQRENLLREIGFVFDPNNRTWRTNYKKLSQYQKENGDTIVPSSDYDGNPNVLGQWVARQRMMLRNGTLCQTRVDGLNDLGFSWEPDAESWDKYYNQLVEFRREHGHTRVPSSMRSLRHWVSRQRRSYRKLLRLQCSNNGNNKDENFDNMDDTLHGTLITNGNIKKLYDIGFEWEDIEFEFGTSKPRKDEVEGRIKRLMNVSEFEFSVHDEIWAKNFQKMCEFHEENGHFSVPIERNKELNTWVRHQRYLYNAEKLPKNRVELLDSINFAWSAEEAKMGKVL